jgi:uncharacterized membrane protein HdeD (DUF308 family)
MTGIDDGAAERARSALTSLSTVGAALAGLGLGALMAPTLSGVAAALLVVGVIAHLIGMVGLRRKLFAADYRPPLWQRLAYWLCWAMIAAVLVYLGWGLLK